MPNRYLIIPGRRQPFQVVLLAFATLAGLTYAFRQAPEPASLDRYVSSVVLGIWYTLLLVGGIVGLAGSFDRHDPVRGLLLERASMVMLATAFTMYAVAAFASAGAAALGGGGSLLAWAAACAWRGVQVHRDLRILRKGPIGTGR